MKIEEIKTAKINEHEDCGGTWLLVGEILDKLLWQCDKCKDVDLD